MKKRFIIIPIVIAIAAIAWIAISYLQNKNYYKKGIITVSGNIEATEVRLSFQVPGKITKLFVDEGIKVKKGDIVATLDKEEYQKVKEQASALLEEAKYNFERLQRDYLRAENLFKDGAIPAQQRDTAKNSFDVALARQEAAKSAIELAELRLSYTDLSSPVDGFIIVKSAEAGEVVQTGTTVFTAIDLNDIWLTAYINETDLGRVKLNQQVDVVTDTYPGKIYPGRISFISSEAEFTPKQIQTTEERVKLVYRIKVRINNTNLELKPGMPADGHIHIG